MAKGLCARCKTALAAKSGFCRDCNAAVNREFRARKRREAKARNGVIANKIEIGRGSYWGETW